MAEKEKPSPDDGEPPKKGKKTLLLVIIVALLIAGGIGLLMSGTLDGILGLDNASGPKKTQENTKEAGEAAAEGKTAAGTQPKDASRYYTLPEIVANLNPGSQQPSFIKMRVALEVPNQEVLQAVEAKQPKIIDIINTYVRELRPSDLQGSAGTYQLREELLMRINKVIEPHEVKDVLFKKLLIQ